MAMAVVAVVTAALALPAAIVYTEHRLAGLPTPERERATDQIELNSWDDFDGLAEWGIVSLLACTVAVGLGWLIARRITRPLRSISAAALHLADGDLGARTGLDRRDELGRLAADFDAMAADLQRLEDERRTAAAATAHELRTPVAIVRARLQAAHDGLLTVDAGEIAVLIDQLDGLTRIIEDLRILSLATAGRLTIRAEPLDLNALLANQVEALGASATDRGVRLVFTPESAVTVDADGDRLAQVITNVTINAIRHSPPDSEVRLHCESRPVGHPPEPGVVEITIADSGPGFPAAIGNPFEAFVTGGQVGATPAGSGLGLSIVKAIIDAHGGQVRASSSTTGATVIITLPTGRTHA